MARDKIKRMVAQKASKSQQQEVEVWRFIVELDPKFREAFKRLKETYGLTASQFTRDTLHDRFNEIGLMPERPRLKDAG